MTAYIALAVASFLAGVLFIGYQIRKAWIEHRRWSWVNIALMLSVFAGTIVATGINALTNAWYNDLQVDVFSTITYVTAMTGAVFWFVGAFWGELIYFLTEHLDKRRTERLDSV